MVDNEDLGQKWIKHKTSVLITVVLLMILILTILSA